MLLFFKGAFIDTIFVFLISRFNCFECCCFLEMLQKNFFSPLHENVFVIYNSKMCNSTRSSIQFFHFLISRYGRKFGSSYHEYLLMKSIPPLYLNTPKSFRAVGLVSTEKNAKNHRTALAPSERLHLFDTSVKNIRNHDAIQEPH